MLLEMVGSAALIQIATVYQENVVCYRPMCWSEPRILIHDVYVCNHQLINQILCRSCSSISSWIPISQCACWNQFVNIYDESLMTGVISSPLIKHRPYSACNDDESLLQEREWKQLLCLLSINCSQTACMAGISCYQMYTAPSLARYLLSIFQLLFPVAYAIATIHALPALRRAGPALHKVGLTLPSHASAKSLHTLPPSLPTITLLSTQLSDLHASQLSWSTLKLGTASSH